MVTRPAPQAGQTCAALHGKGFLTLRSPALVIEPETPADIDLTNVGAVLVTSQNAIGPAFQALATLPVAVVGPATGQRVRELGVEPAIAGQGSVLDLLSGLKRIMLPSRRVLLHLRGTHVAEDIRPHLVARGLELREAIVYRARAITSLDRPVIDALSDRAISAALFYSARSAQVWRSAVPEDLVPNLGEVFAIGISHRVATVLDTHEWASVMVASAPSEESMFDCLEATI